MPRLMRSTVRRGMTLPEVLVAILLLAIVGTGLTRVLVKQQQSYRDLSTTAVSKRELRLGATVLPSELRSISSSGGDIVEMSDSAITMRAYLGSGVVCARTYGAGTANEIWMPPTNLSRHTLTTFVTTPQIGDTVFVYNENVLKGSEDDLWEARRITAVGTSATHCPGAPYADPALDPPASKPRYHYTVDADLPDSVKVGAVVRFSRRVRYKIYQETSGKYYLGLQQYNGSWGTPSPMAGPYTAFSAGDNGNTGLQFRFYDSLGTRITDMTQGTRVARADVYLRTNAGAAAVTERQGRSLRDSVVMRVAIRNFK